MQPTTQTSPLTYHDNVTTRRTATFTESAPVLPHTPATSPRTSHDTRAYIFHFFFPRRRFCSGGNIAFHHGRYRLPQKCLTTRTSSYAKWLTAYIAVPLIASSLPECSQDFTRLFPDFSQTFPRRLGIGLGLGLGFLFQIKYHFGR